MSDYYVLPSHPERIETPHEADIMYPKPDRLGGEEHEFLLEKGVTTAELAGQLGSYMLLDNKLQDFQVSAHNSTLQLELSESERIRAERDARFDDKTKLLRWSFVKKEIESHIEKGHDKFGLLMLDLDGFKNVNDTFGHDVGDMVLQIVAETLKDMQFRGNDRLFRFGIGDELGAYIDMSPAGNARRGGKDFTQKTARDRLIAELVAKIEANVHGNKALNEKEIYAFVSASVSFEPYIKGETADEFFHRVDQGVYDAKTERKAKKSIEQLELPHDSELEKEELVSYDGVDHTVWKTANLDTYLQLVTLTQKDISSLPEVEQEDIQAKRDLLAPLAKIIQRLQDDSLIKPLIARFKYISSRQNELELQARNADAEMQARIAKLGMQASASDIDEDEKINLPQKIINWKQDHAGERSVLLTYIYSESLKFAQTKQEFLELVS